MSDVHGPLVDARHRAAAIAERARNVIVDAGAGTGKTRLLVTRLVSMVAPEDDSAEALDLHRIAAVTFTRKAAGELRLRIRERLLEALADERGDRRRAQLQGALGALDTAHVGTIHSFADRLLRLRPMQARLSPGFDIAEDTGALERETLERLLRGAETRELAGELPPEDREALGPLVTEAEETLCMALDAGVKPEDVDKGFVTQFGLQGWVRGVIAQRDVVAPEVPKRAFDRVAFDNARDRVRAEVRPLTGDNYGTACLRRIVQALDALEPGMSPAEMHQRVRSVRQQFAGYAKNKLRMKDFPGDKQGWEAYKRCTGAGKTDVDPPLLDQVQGVLDRWLALRLMRLAPVVCALYEQVKATHRQVDQLDLLVRLRDMLRDDLEARGQYQAMFDHLFVDEFQDTDPLQAEILVYLAEDGATCRRAEDARLKAGKVTLVGDPKQSIYRFRRADVRMYDAVRRRLVDQGALEVELTTNFRSTSTLIGWLNHRFEGVLGRGPDGRRFDPETGEVFHQPLAWRRQGAGAAVHAVPYPAGRNAGDTRRQEGQVMARYLRWLVGRSGLDVEDPVTGARRPVEYGDVAVLAAATPSLAHLFAALDGEHIPYASRGGTLFLGDALHQRFLLGLRALSDRDDGIARAALLRPPFFAIDPRDLALDAARRRAESMEDTGAWDPSAPEVDEALARVAQANACVAALRRARFTQGVERTARDLLEQTGFARHVARGPNGAQRLARLRELCFSLGQMAHAEGLCFDDVTARARQWVDAPVSLDPPHPVGAGAVQVLTIHQAKGLEFPVVLLWDGRARMGPGGGFGGALRQDRDGRAWHLALEAFDHEEPAHFGLADREKRYDAAERTRLVYVAATRARDLLVLPKPDPEPQPGYICGALLADAPEGSVRELAPYGAEGVAPGETWWDAETDGAQDGRASRDGAEDEAALEARMEAAWTHAAHGAAAPRFLPTGVVAAAQGAVASRAGENGEIAAAHAAVDTDVGTEAEPPPPRRTQPPKKARYGTTFGIAVHRALELVLTGAAADGDAAVTRAAAEAGLTDHLAEARADVTRGLHALRRIGVTPDSGASLRLEYPVAGMGEGGRLLNGSIDLLAQVGDELWLLDFKTDPPPEGDLGDAHAVYEEQLRLYARLLASGGWTGPLRTGLLFTGDGGVRWVE